MNCKFHSNKEGVSKCKICGAELCKDCTKFAIKFDRCPKCAQKQISYLYSRIKHGLVFNILGVVCALAFLVMYIVALCLGQLDKDFIVIGAVVLAFLLPITIIMFVYSIKNLKSYKKYLKL